jgi:hypothetical protein
MKLDEIYQLWEQDSKIDRSELAEESLKIPQLHHKYYKIYTNEKLILNRLNYSLKELFRKKHEYYRGVLSQEDLAEHGWEPQQMTILRQDLQIYLESDKDLDALQIKIDTQKEKIDLLESIIKSLQTRGYQIKSAIDFIKFQMGA